MPDAFVARTSDLMRKVFAYEGEPWQIVRDAQGEPFAVVFPLDGLLLKFVKDRGEEFVDVCFRDCPGQFFYFDDVSVGLDWESLDQALSRTEPRPLIDVLRQLAGQRRFLRRSLETHRAGEIVEAIEAAARNRAQAVEARFRARL